MHGGAKGQVWQLGSQQVEESIKRLAADMNARRDNILQKLAGFESAVADGGQKILGDMMASKGQQGAAQHRRPPSSRRLGKRSRPSSRGHNSSLEAPSESRASCRCRKTHVELERPPLDGDNARQRE